LDFAGEDDIAAFLKLPNSSFREKGRRSEFFNHLSAISESIPALGWVTMAPTPAPFIKEMNDAGQFYTNRVLKERRRRNTDDDNFCSTLNLN
jgi:adenylyl cyclase-associated protein